MEARGLKNVAGDWLRGKAIDRTVSAAMMLMAVTGFGLGFGVRGFPVFDGDVGVFAAAGAIVAAVLAFAAFYEYCRRTDSRWARGFRAERHVGDLIEQALTKPGCAFAHDVKEALDGSGNVDHVVMTPAAIWVVETKSGWVDRRQFSKVLHQVAGNVRRVRRHLGTALPVRGALVIANRGDRVLDEDYDCSGEPVRAFDPKTFWRLLRQEREHDPTVGCPSDMAAVEEMVWKLGSMRHLDS